MDHLLSLLIFLPVAGAIVLAVLPAGKQGVYRWVALGISVLQCILLIPLLLNYQSGSMQFEEMVPWIRLDLKTLGTLAANYHVGVDGLNIWLVVLSVVILLISTISSWENSDRNKGYFSLLLLLNGAVIGCFTALDYLLFYLFFEFMLLPMFFLIGLWGGPRKDYAAIKFFLYTLFGSVLILIAMIMFYTSAIDPVETGKLVGLPVAKIQVQLANGQLSADKLVHTFDMIHLTDPGNIIPGSILDGTGEFMGLSLRMWAFLLVFVGFAVKVPVVPVHTWLPDAHVEAPTAISVVLAGILLKVGAYGMVRGGILILPDGFLAYAWLMGLLGVISIIYGALNALASKDLKRLVAYSSVSHMGFVMLGLASGTPEGISGAIYQLVSHGVISAALFLLVGVLYDRVHDRMIANYSGLASKLPAFTILSVIFFFASMGLPGMSGFIAEILVLLGAFSSALTNSLLSRWLAILAATGMILSAAYYLWTLQRMYFGKFFIRGHDAKVSDVQNREYLMLVPLALITLILGIFPAVLLDWINPFVIDMIDIIQSNGALLKDKFSSI